MYHIKISGNNVFAKEYCNFCGGYFEAGDVICFFAEDEEKCFFVCDRCLEAGTEGFPSILRNRVRRLKKFAAFLEYLSNQKIEYPREEHERLKKEAEEYWINYEKENKFVEK